MSLRLARIASILLLILGLNRTAYSGPPYPLGPIYLPANTTNIWVPDFLGQAVYQNQLYRIAGSAEQAAETSSYYRFRQNKYALPASCNPNSVAVGTINSTIKLYVACNSSFGRSDQILVYNLIFDASSPTLTTLQPGQQPAVITNAAFNGLVAMTFDHEGNLWVSSSGNSMLLRVPSAQLATASPAIDRSVTINLGVFTPASGGAGVAGITVDPADHSFWVVGQLADSGGYLANFSDSAMNTGSTTPTPTSCFAAAYANSAVPSGNNCTITTTLHMIPGGKDAPVLLEPEGVAVTGNSVWVGNNGGNAPAASIVQLTKNGGNPPSNPRLYGQSTNRPFACPGGMFAETSSGPLWVNDEGYKVPNTDCGSSSSDLGVQLGQVLMFPLTTLKPANATSPTQWMGGAWNVIRAGSPGFGGIFVQDTSYGYP